MKYLITGNAGFIGSHITERLVNEGHEVAGIDDLSAGKLSNLETVRKQIKFIHGSICDLNTVMKYSEHVDVIIHLATQCLVKGLNEPTLMHRVNDIGTFNICLSAQKHGCKIIFIGTSEMYGPQNNYPINENAPLNPISIYGQTKVIAENYVKYFNRVHNIPAVCIRPFNTYGPRQREDGYAGVITSFIKRLKINKPPLIDGGGFQTRDFTYISDMVDGILLLGNKLNHGETVNLGSQTETSINLLAMQLNEFWNPKKVYIPVHRQPRINDLKRLLADIRLAISYGYTPKITLQEGLRKYVNWYKTRNKT